MQFLQLVPKSPKGRLTVPCLMRIIKVNHCGQRTAELKVPKGQAAAAAAQTTENGQAAEMNQTATQSEEAAAQTQNAKEE